MPIIKDKYGAKGSATRSKYQTRKKNKAIMEPAPVGVGTDQKKELFKESFRVNPQNKSQTTIVSDVGVLSSEKITSTQSVTSSVGNFSFAAANSVDLLLTLNQGETLNNIVIHNYNGSSSAATIGVYWSSGDQSNISFTASSGVVTATAGGSSTCIFSSSFPYLSAVDLSETVSSLYKNVNKDIVFYVVSSIAGPSISFSVNAG